MIHSLPQWKRFTAVALAAVALIGSTVVFAAPPRGAAGCHPPHHRFSEADASQMSERMVERVGQRLSLNAEQKTRLKALADALHAQRKAMAGGQAPHEQWLALVAGNRFDRAAAQAQAEARAQQIRDGSPAVIQAAGDFFDGLSADQQAQVREFLKRGPGGWHREGGPVAAPRG